MIGNLADAVSKYGQAAGLPKVGGGAAEINSISFGDVMRDVTQNIADSQKKAEEISGQAAVGKANLVDVMTAINNAETTLQTVVAIRDRLVQSIQEVMRMAV
jgi:flagellar hook-basal body complex protein FliE